MKNFDMAQFPSPERCVGLGVTRVPSLSCCSPSTTTCSPGLRPSSINPHRSHRFAGFHGAHANFVIAADDGHLVASLRLRNGALGQQQGAFFQVVSTRTRPYWPGRRMLPGLGKGSNDANRARAWIHLPVRKQDFAF